MSSLRSLRSENPSISNYSDLVEIGKGGFGIVFKARNKFGEVVAIKQISRKKHNVRVDDEIRVLKQLNSGAGHNRIVRYFESFNDDKNTYIVMEYCERGNLRNYIKKIGALDEPIAADVLFQLVEGVSLMHKIGIMHRDLTASNVLISRVKDSRLFVKIADFGLTKKTPVRATLGTCLGTPGYIAPQVRNKQEYGKLADVYSLGAILFAMLNNSDPPEISWDGDGCPRFDGNVRSRVSGKALDLLQRMMCKHEDQRIKLEEMDSHPFIQLAHASRLEEMKLSAPLVRGHRGTADSGRGSGSGSNHARSSSRCRHPSILPNSQCRDCGFTLLVKRNVNANTLIPVTNVPMISSRRSIPTSENTAPTNRTSKSANVATSSNSSPKNPLFVWPVPDIRHLAYITTNKYGRFSIRPDERPSMVYEMPDENGNVQLIFELYDNSVPNGQRLLVYKPKARVPIPEKSDRFLEKSFGSEIRLRSGDDVTKAPAEIKLGYKRLWQFISLAKTRVTQYALRNTFGVVGFNMDLKYSGTIELTLADGRKASKSPKGEMSGDQLSPGEHAVFQCGCIKLRQTMDQTPFEHLVGSDRIEVEQFLRRPCVTTWAKKKL